MSTEDTPLIRTAPFKADGLPTLIGSLPLTDHNEALAWIFAHTPEIPLWPQLPGKPGEGMLQQFVEGFPGITEDENRTYFNVQSAGFEEELVAFFEEYLAVSEDPILRATSRFKVSQDRAAGIYCLAAATGSKEGIRAVKGQITGPFTLLTGLTDQNRRLGYYDETIREMAVKGLAMKAAWQVAKLGEAGKPVLLFIDEPALAGLGSSAFISISQEAISADLTEVINAVHEAGGLAGIHVCANTDWGFLLAQPLDILSFDAYGFFDRLIGNKEQVLAFLARGGILAWGIVPTSERNHIIEETPESLIALWEKQAGQLVSAKLDLPALLRQSLITPSCGTGSLTPDLAARVLGLTRDVSAILRKKYLPTE
ncbi:MAG: hypothetical protein A2511_04960 [Deltaproteobacteria bacterium RIFOXYD12_FULL_50_9]|nr:MAG: hypothetical protein A2511_04960 [Deltaproteobacteria bacterium RIFOXYD12_FULL_50_9]